jgi:hypothetical protein
MIKQGSHSLQGHMNDDGATCLNCRLGFTGLQLFKGVAEGIPCGGVAIQGGAGERGGYLGGAGGGSMLPHPRVWMTVVPSVPSIDHAKAADALLSLINSKPRSPTRDELIATLKSL